MSLDEIKNSGEDELKTLALGYGGKVLGLISQEYLEGFDVIRSKRIDDYFSKHETCMETLSNAGVNSWGPSNCDNFIMM